MSAYLIFSISWWTGGEKGLFADHSPGHVPHSLGPGFPRRLAILSRYLYQYFPGWRAWVDGHETLLHRANYAYQALPLKTAGPHAITLKFVPTTFRIGLWVGLASLVVVVGFGIGAVKSGMGSSSARNDSCDE